MLLVAILTLAGLGGPAPEPIQRLDDPDWRVRQAATETLAEVGTDAGAAYDAAIMEALTRPDLSEEARVRLTRLAVRRFRSVELGALGVSFGAAGEGAVTIQSVVAGFPASDVLRAGDTVLAVGNEMIGGQNHLRAEILSRRPGDTLPVLVRRDRTVLELDLPLGSYTGLDAAAALDDETVLWAMTLRFAREGVAVPRPEPVGTGLKAEAWLSAAFPEGRDGRAPGGGERVSPGIALGPAGLDREAASRRRSAWATRDDAVRTVSEQLRADLGRRMTAGVRTRSVLVEFERALGDRLRRAETEGEDASAVAATLAELRERMRALDAWLTETARAMDAGPG